MSISSALENAIKAYDLRDPNARPGKGQVVFLLTELAEAFDGGGTWARVFGHRLREVADGIRGVRRSPPNKWLVALLKDLQTKVAQAKPTAWTPPVLSDDERLARAYALEQAEAAEQLFLEFVQARSG